MTREGKTVPESIYRKHVLRARSTRNHFTFCRDWVWIMTKMEALFLQDLINRASSPKADKQIIDGKEFVLLSNKYLQKPPMSWDDRTCTKHLASLEEKGFVQIVRRGWKGKRFCRWVHIDVLQIETVLDEVAKDTPGGVAQRYPSRGTLTDPSRGSYNAQSYPWRGSKESSNKSNKVQSKKSSLSPDFVRATSTSKGFFPEGEKKIGRSQDKDRAHRLWDKLVEKRLLDKKSKFRSWIKEFRDLRDKDGAPDEEIEETLKKYLPRITITMSSKEEGCLPQAFSARTFRVKYVNIRARLACLEKESGNSDRVGDILYRKAKAACAIKKEYDVTRKGKLRRYLPGRGDVWEEVPLKEWNPPNEVFAFIRYVLGEYTPTEEDLK